MMFDRFGTQSYAGLLVRIMKLESMPAMLALRRLHYRCREGKGPTLQEV